MTGRAGGREVLDAFAKISKLGPLGGRVCKLQLTGDGLKSLENTLLLAEVAHLYSILHFFRYAHDAIFN